jgi:sugar-specific transcriptional regulator TrmB
LNGMGQLQGTQVVKSDYYSCCLPVINSKNKTLYSINQDKNDEQIKNVINYCIEQNYQRIPFSCNTK